MGKFVKIRLTESELRNIVNNVAMRIVKNRLNEDVLGDNWHEAETEETPFNNYEPFEDQMENQDDHNWGGVGEEDIDPSFYEDPDNYRDDVIGSNDNPSDGDLYGGRW